MLTLQIQVYMAKLAMMSDVYHMSHTCFNICANHPDHNNK